jgi:hypothetical protein
MIMNSSVISKTLLAGTVLALAALLSTPAKADPPWRHGGHPGWERHHEWRGEHRGVRVREYYPGYYYAPPPVVVVRPRPVYMPPPVVYERPSPGIDIHFPLYFD